MEEVIEKVAIEVEATGPAFDSSGLMMDTLAATDQLSVTEEVMSAGSRKESQQHQIGDSAHPDSQDDLACCVLC